MEDDQVKSEISDCDVSIASIDEKDSQEYQLVERQRMGSDPMHANLNVSPARWLPPELVAEILVQSQPSHIEMLSNSTLYSICSAWRAVALSTPRLWTTVRMTLSNNHFSDKMALIRLWCERAGSLPLRIYLSSGPLLSGNPILELSSYLPNVQTMELGLPKPCIEHLQSLSKGTFRLLEFLSIHIKGDVMETALDAAHINVFESAQRLTHVSISSLGSRCRLLLPPQISHIVDHTRLSADAYFCVLQHCPNIEHLDLYIDWDEDMEVMGHQTFLLPHLHTLNLHFYGDSQEVVFHSLVVPALRIIEIKMQIWEEWPYLSFLSLLSRSSCAPVRLSMHNAYVDSPFLECLRGLPSIVELELLDVSFVGPWLPDALVYDEDDPDPLVPRLEVFSLFSNSTQFSSPRESLLWMIESRWWPDAQLSDPHRVARLKVARSNILSFSEYFDKPLFDRLEICQREGLRVGDEYEY